MIKRVVDITRPAFISLRQSQLIIDAKDGESLTVPVEDLAILLLSNPAISITEGAQIACVENNTLIVCCDSHYLPSGILLPLSAHTTSAKIARQQAIVSRPRRKRLWQTVVKQKINEQGDTLSRLGKDPEVALRYLEKVQSGDSTNVESQAARAYWPALFGKEFRRERDLPGTNSLLNYGYAIIRSAVARAIVGSGLLPVFGLQHSNQYNHLALVDDLVEPFRPWIDELVVRVLEGLEPGEDPHLGTSEKRALLEILSTPCRWEGKSSPFMVVLHTYAAAVRDILCGSQAQLEFPRR